MTPRTYSGLSPIRERRPLPQTELLRAAATAALHLCKSLLACREALTDDLIQEVAECLEESLIIELRDPRGDPRPGDVLRNWGRTHGEITIIRREGSTESIVVFNSSACYRRVPVIYFTRMAIGAIVVKRGGE